MSSTTTTTTTAWDRLIRYVSAQDGTIKLGEPIVTEQHPDLDALALSGHLKVKVLSGPTPFQATHTGDEDQVKQLLGPLTPEDVPSIRCIGLNYRSHSPSISIHPSIHPFPSRTSPNPPSPTQSSKPASPSRPTPQSS
jgi:hypothetical protein